MPGRTFAENERFWQETLTNRDKMSALTRGTLLVMAVLFAIITAPLVVLAVLGIRPWEGLAWVLVIEGIGLLGLYGLLGLMRHTYRFGQRWGEKRRREGRKGFLDRPAGPRTKTK